MKNFIKNFYSNNFVYKGKEKLSKLTIFALIILNIFILSTLYQGIDFQTRVLNNPNTKFPYDCRDVLNYTSSIDDFNSYLYNNYNYNTKYQNIKDLEVDERCNLITEKIEIIKNNIDIKSLKQQNEELNNKSYEINSQITYLEENYNTILFEKMSKQNNSKSIVKGELTAENVKEKYETLDIKNLRDGDCINVSKHIEIEQTFGANIHSLLSHGFFMDKGFMGEFAKTKINDVYKYLVNNNIKKRFTQNEVKYIIDLIGEPILKKQLQVFYDEKFEVDEIDKQIREHEEAIKKLKSKKKKND